MNVSYCLICQEVFSYEDTNICPDDPDPVNVCPRCSTDIEQMKIMNQMTELTKRLYRVLPVESSCIQLVYQIKALELTPEDRLKESWLGNWTYLSMCLAENKTTLRDYLVLMKLELDGKSRKHIINRLRTKYNSIRVTEEWKLMCKEFEL